MDALKKLQYGFSVLLLLALVAIMVDTAQANLSTQNPLEITEPNKLYLPVIVSQKTKTTGPFVSSPVTPRIFDADLRTLPVVPPWQPGDPEEYVPRDPGFTGTGNSPGFESLATALPAPGTDTLLLDTSAKQEGLQPSSPNDFASPFVNFDGIPYTGFRPPDTVGDVGPEHYIQMVNISLSIYTKTMTTPAVGPININSLWDDFGGLCETTNRGDPIVLYDPLADQWLISQFAFATDASNNPIPPYEECIAISRTGNPVSGGWFLYDFNVHNSMFPDYPKLGVWPDAYYMSTNQFGGTGGGGAYAFDRANMLVGNPATFVYFDTNQRNMLPSDLDGPTPPPAGSPNYFVKFVDGAPDRLEIRQFQVNWGAPGSSTFGGLINLPTAAFDSNMCGGFFQGEQCIPQPGTAQGLASLADRLMWRLQYRNFGPFETIVANHTVDVDGTDRAGIRWYELRRVGGAWAIFQQGTFSPDANHRWMGSVAMDNAGNMALGYSISSNTMFPSINYVGRLAADPPGTMPQGEFQLQAGSGSQTACQAVDVDNNGTIDFCRGRWGDYSAMSVDPVDDCTFWYTQEYIAPNGNWRTRIGAFSFCNHPPEADAGGPYFTNEGEDVPLDGSNSTDLDGDVLTYEWDLDNDSVFDDAFTPTATFDAVGQDGIFTIHLRVTDPDGEMDVDTTTVTVVNVSPSVDLASDSPVDENSQVTVSGIISDPGWLEMLAATIDWGDGTTESVTGVLENIRPDATLTFAVLHVYGDNGNFTAEICGSDDDTTICETILLQIDNVDPTAEIDETGAILINGIPSFLGQINVPLDFNARSADPGSDDLHLSWDWDDGPPEPDITTNYWADPSMPDPFPSPSIYPRDVIDMQTHTFVDACLYEIAFLAADDDGGHNEDSAFVLIVGDASQTRTAGYWLHQYRQNGNTDFDEDTLLCYLEIVGFLSQVFHEERDASTIALAIDVLWVNNNNGDMEEIFDRQLLAVWLNFVNGSLALNQMVDTDGNGTPDTLFADVVAAAEAVRLDPNATREELEVQKDILESINLSSDG